MREEKFPSIYIIYHVCRGISSWTHRLGVFAKYSCITLYSVYKRPSALDEGYPIEHDILLSSGHSTWCRRTFRRQTVSGTSEIIMIKKKKRKKKSNQIHLSPCRQQRRPGCRVIRPLTAQKCCKVIFDRFPRDWMNGVRLYSRRRHIHQWISSVETAARRQRAV